MPDGLNMLEVSQIAAGFVRYRTQRSPLPPLAIRLCPFDEGRLGVPMQAGSASKGCRADARLGRDDLHGSLEGWAQTAVITSEREQVLRR
jgi:hypothetical protein